MNKLGSLITKEKIQSLESYDKALSRANNKDSSYGYYRTYDSNDPVMMHFAEVTSYIKEELKPLFKNTFLVKETTKAKKGDGSAGSLKYNDTMFQFRCTLAPRLYNVNTFDYLSFVDNKYLNTSVYLKYKATKKAELRSSRVMPFDVSFYIILNDIRASDNVWRIIPSINGNSLTDIPNSALKYEGTGSNFYEAHDAAYSNIHEMIAEYFDRIDTLA
jgi:hypothetical protein